MKVFRLRVPKKSQRWRHGDGLRARACRALVAMAMGLTAVAACAACPPTEADGVAIAKGDLVLAYRPLLADARGTQANRIPMAKHFALDIQLCARDGALDLQLSKADASMPEHRHGMNYRPVITGLGGGRFRVDGMMFHMAGRWQLAFEVRAGKETIRLSHDLQID